VIEPVPIALPLLHPYNTQLTHVACGRAHTVIVTDNEGGINIVISLISDVCFISFTPLTLIDLAIENVRKTVLPGNEKVW